MKDEIKEAIDNLDGVVKEIYRMDEAGLEIENIKIILDYITDLQDTLKDREEYCYALETQLTDLQEEVKSANESITWWTNRFNALHEENKRLKEILENLTTMTVNGDRTQIKNTAQHKLDIYKLRNEKAIKCIKDKYYKLQDDYTKQSFYIYLDKEERKQYDYEDFLLDKIEEKDKEIERLNNIIDELDRWLEQMNKYNIIVFYSVVKDKLKELKEDKLKGGNNE